MGPAGLHPPGMGPDVGSPHGSVGAQVHVLGGRTGGASTLGEMGSFPVLHPLLTAAVESHPRYDGEDVHWAVFEREWEEHVKVLNLACGGRAMDVLLLEQLRKSLDRASQMHLQMCKEANPQLSYEEYIGELRHLHGCDVNAQNRRAWEGVRFHMRDPENPTAAELRVFKAEFELKAARVEGRTAAEEHRLVFQQLPRRWQEEITRTETKRTRGHHWVRITQLPPMSKGEVCDMLEKATSEAVGKVQPCDAGFMVECDSEALMPKILGFNGWVLKGQTVRVSRAEKKLSAAEMFGRITELVAVQQNVEHTRNAYGCSRANVAAYDAESPGGKSAGSRDFPRSSPATPPAASHREPHGKGTAQAKSPKGGSPRGSKGRGRGKGTTPDRSGRGKPSSAAAAYWNSCWHCQGAGLDGSHDWKACADRRREEHRNPRKGA